MFQRPRFELAAMALVLAASTPALRAAPSPYAGQASREIKSLSAQEVQSLLGGRGMGFAKAAELNGYPGPAHVVELEGELALSAEQRQRTRTLFEAMQRDAIMLGKALVEAEREIDRLFADGTVTPQSLGSALARAGELQAQLRAVHLQAHIEQAQIMEAGQIERYSVLRGYGRGHGLHGHGEQAGQGGYGAHESHDGEGDTAVHRPLHRR